MKKIYTLLMISGLLLKLSAQTTLPTSWNFSSPGISTPPTGWTMGLGTNGNLTYAFGVGDGLSARLDATGEYILISFTDKPGALSYYLSPQNAGSAWGGQFDIQESANGSSWNSIRSVTYKASTSTNYNGGKYIDNLSNTSRYVRFFYTTKLPGGSPSVPGGNMGVDSVLIQAAPPAITPKLNVKRGNVSLVNGSTSVIGNISSTPFIIENLGTVQTLSIDSIKFSGTASADYGVSGMPITVASDSNKTILVTFSPAQQGTRLAKMNIYSNDPDRSVFEINLYGVGGSYANEPIAQASALNFSSINAFGFNGNFSSAGTGTEHFIVLRKQNSTVNEIPVDGYTYKKGDYIGQAQVELISDSGVLIKPTYILANSNYHYAIYSYNGPAGFENYLTVNPLKNSVSTPGKNMGNYYVNIDPNKSDFISKLSQKINPHDTIYYSNYISRLVNTWLARDTSNGKKAVTCVYTGHQFVYDEPFLWANGNNGAVLTREHTYAQSWMPSNQSNPDWPNAQGTTKELPEYNDLHHLYPAHQTNGNVRRSNHPFGEVLVPSYVSPTGYGMVGTDSASNVVYEPRAEQKGDLARALFYMAVCYHGISSNNWSLPISQNMDILRLWNLQDPPDNFEIARHEFIAAQQHNRNPFIDHPEWAYYINFKNMTYINGDTTPVKKPLIILLEPNAGSVWEKAKTVKVKWTSVDVDSVFIFFSSDSLKTKENIGSAIAADRDSFSFVYSQTLKSSKGKVIIMDPISGKGDTSEYFNLIGSSSLYEPFSDENIRVYPNPVTEGKVKIEVGKKGGDCQLILMNLLGIKLVQLNFRDEITLDLSSYPAGVYYLCIVNNSEFKAIKLIKE